MVDEQRGPVVASGTPRVQGYPTPHERHGRQRGQAVKAGHRPPPPGGAQRPLLPGPAGAPSPTKRDGVQIGAACRSQGTARSAVQAVGLCGDAPASRGKERGTGTAPPRTSTPSAGGGGSPLGGRTGHLPARAKGAQAPGPTGWAGANSTDRAPAPDQNSLCRCRRHGHAGQWLPGVWLGARAMPHAQGVGAQDITGVACGGATKRSFSAATGHATCNSPLC